jgi:hypothetical protein
MYSRKKIVVLVAAALMADAASADTAVTIGGVYDVGYMFKRTANADNTTTGNGTGGITTETLGDGAGQGSRITVLATEDIAPGWLATVTLDLRFGVVEEGSDAATTGGLNTNDRKALFLTSPYGALRWGVQSLANAQYWDYEEKPYMVNITDTEVVKYGVSGRRNEALTARNTEYDTPILSTGSVRNRMKFNYAIGDNRKSGTSNTASSSSGDVFGIAETGCYGQASGGCLVGWGFSSNHRTDTVEGVAPSARTGMHFSENYINIHPMTGLKLAMAYNVYKGYGDSATTSNGIFKEKDTNFVIAYNYGSLWQIGAGRGHLNDLGITRNSGSSWMIGGEYFLSKSVFLFIAREKDDYARNEAGYKKYMGTKTGFVDSWTKQDMVYTRVGMVKTF